MPSIELLDCTQNGRPAEHLENSLGNPIVGPHESIHQFVRAYQTYVAGLSPVGRPIGHFLLLGPANSGKTRIVEATAESLLNNSRAVININCAEFQDSHGIAKLIGSAPGYLGHGETHPLLSQDSLNRHHTDKVNVSFVFFDEIEKASDALWNLLLGILDKGTLTLGDNRKVDFSTTIVFLTTSFGAAEMSSLVCPLPGIDARSLDDTASTMNLSARTSGAGLAAARRKFKPEFISRLDNIVVFKSIGRAQPPRIDGIELERVHRRSHAAAANKPFLVKATDAAKEFLLAEGIDSRYGARHLKRTIERLVVEPLSNLLASGQNPRDDCIPVSQDTARKFGRAPKAMRVWEVTGRAA